MECLSLVGPMSSILARSPSSPSGKGSNALKVETRDAGRHGPTAFHRKTAVRSVPSQDRRSARVIWVFREKARLTRRLGHAAVLLQAVGEFDGEIDAFANLAGGLRAVVIGPAHPVERVQQAFEMVRQHLLAKARVLARAC